MYAPGGDSHTEPEKVPVDPYGERIALYSSCATGTSWHRPPRDKLDLPSELRRADSADRSPPRNLLRWPNVRFVQLCGGDDDLGNKLYQARCFHVFNELILGTGRLERSGDASNSRPEKQVQCDMSVNPTCS